MEPRNASVEEIWKKLKSTGPCHNVSNILRGEGLTRGAGASHVDVTGRLDSGVYWPTSSNHRTTTKQKLRSINTDNTTAERVILTHVDSEDQLEEALQRELQCIKNGTGQTRKAALETIKASLFCESASEGPPHSLVQEATGGFLGKALLKRFDDPQEKCRLLAVDILRSLLQIPAEQSEDIRAKLLQLLHSLVNDAGSAIASYGTELKETLELGCNDSYHEVNIEACSILQLMNEKLGHRLYQISKELVAMVMPLTTHKRQKVRVEAVKTVKVLMHQGAHEMILEITSFIDPNVVPVKAFYGEDLKVNFLGKLATDPCPKVRMEFLLMISDWMLNLRERLDHESRLIPYALSALNDECPEVAAEAVRLMDALGLQYEKEHQEDLKDTLYYLPQEAHALGWGLFSPFTRRPRLGTRILVQANFSRMIRAITSELTSWQSDIRARILQLLRSCVVLVEDHVAMWLDALLGGLCSVVRHDGVSTVLEEICFIMGCFVNPSKFLDLLVPVVRDEDASSLTKMAAVRILGLILKGSAQRDDLALQIPRLVDFVEGPTFTDIADINLALASFDVCSAVGATLSGVQIQQYGLRLAYVLLQIGGGALLRGQAPAEWLARVVWTAATSNSELHALLMAWTLLPLSQENMLAICSGDPAKKRSTQQASCKDTSLTDTECRTVLSRTKGALSQCVACPVAFSRLLVALVMALEELETVPLDEHEFHVLSNDVVEAAVKTKDENCKVGALQFMALAASRSCPGDATSPDNIAQTERLLSNSLTQAAPVRSAVCRTVEAAFAEGSFMNAASLSIELIESVMRLLDDSQSVVRRSADRALVTVLQKSESCEVDGGREGNERLIVERIKGEIEARMKTCGDCSDLNLIKETMVAVAPPT
ncbi:hypothetical protein BSKO_08452 [Bryopsis sp. KO-2023]|nr:hypothetical protein BSKO_08452 [Bryopsis sp. KO-2023]